MLAAGGWLTFGPKKADADRHRAGLERRGEGACGVTVEVVRPTAGGIDRVCVQPGSVEPFEAADLYAKVSGFLAEQSVAIGSRVATMRSTAPERPGPTTRPAGSPSKPRAARPGIGRPTPTTQPAAAPAERRHRPDHNLDLRRG